VRLRKRDGAYRTQLLILYNDASPLPPGFGRSPVRARTCVACLPTSLHSSLRRRSVNNVFRVLRATAPPYSDADLRKICTPTSRTLPPPPIRQTVKLVVVAHHAGPDHPAHSIKTGMSGRALSSTLMGRDSCMACLEPISPTAPRPATQCLNCKCIMCDECTAAYFVARGPDRLCFSGRESCGGGRCALVGAGLPTSMPITDVVQEITRFLKANVHQRVALVYNDSDPQLAQALEASMNSITDFMVRSLCLPSLDGVVGVVPLSDLQNQIHTANYTIVCGVNLPLEVTSCLCSVPLCREALHLHTTASVRAMSAEEAAFVFGSGSVAAAREFALAVEPLERPQPPAFPPHVSPADTPVPELQLQHLQHRPLLWDQGLRVTP